VDEDSPDADDFLGRVSIGTGLVSHATASFTGDDANYKLWYTVADVPIQRLISPRSIKGFEISTKPGVWPYIPKMSLLGDIRRTTGKPTTWLKGQLSSVARQPSCSSLCRVTLRST